MCECLPLPEKRTLSGSLRLKDTISVAVSSRDGVGGVGSKARWQTFKSVCELTKAQRPGSVRIYFFIILFGRVTCNFQLYDLMVQALWRRIDFDLDTAPGYFTFYVTLRVIGHGGHLVEKRISSCRIPRELHTNSYRIIYGTCNCTPKA